MTYCNEMIYQQVTLSGDAEWPKVADAVIEAELRHHYFNELGATKLACLWVLEHLGKTKRR